jgi:hypothetical protein
MASSASVNDASPRRNNSKNKNINSISNGDSVRLWQASQSEIEQFRVPESIYRWVPIEEGTDKVGLTKPAFLGLFRNKHEATWDEKIVRDLKSSFEVECKGETGVSCNNIKGHCTLLESAEELRRCLDHWRKGIKPDGTFSVSEQILIEAGEKDILEGFNSGMEGSWSGNKMLPSKLEYCYELPSSSPLPKDLKGVLDNASTGHVSITFKEKKGQLMFVRVMTRKAAAGIGVHKELVENTDWKLHCFRITAKADINETVYPDPDVLKLLQCVDQYMDVCDEEDFSALMCALNDTHIIDEKEKTLKGIFINSPHAPLFLRAINNIKESLTEEEQDKIEGILQSVEELRVHYLQYNIDSSDALLSEVGIDSNSGVDRV